MTQNDYGHRVEHTKLIVFFIILILLTLAFIWGNSLTDIPSSREESLKVGEVIEPVLEPIVGEGNVTDHLVRKLAHFAEFFALGCELIALAFVRGKRGWKPVGVCLLTGLAVAAIDETIQVFSNRGSQVQDVLLDFSGFCTGMLFAGLIVCLITEIRRHKKP